MSFIFIPLGLVLMFINIIQVNRDYAFFSFICLILGCILYMLEKIALGSVKNNNAANTEDGKYVIISRRHSNGMQLSYLVTFDEIQPGDIINFIGTREQCLNFRSDHDE